MKILVTDGDSRASLAITRSLGKKGHQIFVANTRQPSLAGQSRFCHKKLIYPNTDDHDAFVMGLQQLVIANDIDILIPVTDICLLPVIKNRDKFASICKLPFPQYSSVARAADKLDMLKLAVSLEVPIPTSMTIVCKSDIDNELKPIDRFPIVIKPSRSRVYIEGGWIFSGVDYAVTPGELRKKLYALHSAAFPVLLQERIEGPGLGLFYCFCNGEPVAIFAHRRIREKPPSGGVSVLRESVIPHAKACDYGISLLRALHWHGVAMVEFKMDERDQLPKLMEINGRFWGSLQLAIDAGVDFPALLVNIANEEKVDPVLEYKLGVRSRWVLGEIDLLLMFALNSRQSLQLPASHPSRFKSLLLVLNPFIAGQKLEVLRLSDLRPWLYEFKHWLSDLIH